MNEFLIGLGFKASPLDACFYRRADALLILYCDDLRIGASNEVLVSIHAALFARFDVTTAKSLSRYGFELCVGCRSFEAVYDQLYRDDPRTFSDF